MGYTPLIKMKVVFVSSMLPSGHYSQFITNGLFLQKGLDLIIYADRNPDNLGIKNCGKIKLVWSKSAKFVYEIVRELRTDKPDIVHIQQEMNMYGGIATTILFPILVLLFKILRFKVVVTIHAAVYKKQINKEFIRLFHRNSGHTKPIHMKILFYYIFKMVSLFSNLIIVHTFLNKDILSRDYGVSTGKIVVIPNVIPQKSYWGFHPRKYFFYFGYMVRRKGLEYALDGFGRFMKSNYRSKFRLIMAGGTIKGQEKALEEIKLYIKSKKLQTRIKILGYVEEKELDRLFGDAYAVVIPAKVSMGSSGPLFHARSYGKCVIASRVGHLIEDIEHLKDGILTENDKWNEAFEFAVNHTHKVSSIEKNVLKLAASRTPFIIAQKYKKLYQSLF